MTIRTARTRNTFIWLVVALVHVVVLWWLAIGRTALPPQSFQPPVELWLVPPSGGGGGAASVSDSPDTAASAPSSLHRPPELFKVFPDAPVAPPEPSVEQAPVLAAGVAPAPVPAPTSGIGLTAAPVSEGAGAGLGGGRGGGNGAGTGSGAGDGPGSGIALIRGPRGAVVTANPTPEMLNGLDRPYATLTCWLESGNPRLRNCRVAHESRPGVGAIALKASSEWVFRPPARLGRSTRRVRVTVAHAPSVDSPAAEGTRR